MKTESVIFFYRMDKIAGREYPWQHTKFVIKKIPWGERTIFAVGIPEYDYARKYYKPEKLKKMMRKELIPQLEELDLKETVYLCHKSLVSLIHIMGEFIPLDQYRMDEGQVREYGVQTPEDIFGEMLEALCRYDSLIVINRDDGILGVNETTELVRKCSQGINYLGIVTQKAEEFEDLLEEINEEYGLTAITDEDLENLHPPLKYSTLVVDFSLEDKKEWRKLPSGCTYLDAYSVSNRRRLMEARRKDVKYLSFVRQIEKKIHIMSLES